MYMCWHRKCLMDFYCSLKKLPRNYSTAWTVGNIPGSILLTSHILPVKKKTGSSSVMLLFRRKKLVLIYSRIWWLVCFFFLIVRDHKKLVASLDVDKKLEHRITWEICGVPRHPDHVPRYITVDSHSTVNNFKAANSHKDHNYLQTIRLFIERSFSQVVFPRKRKSPS